MKISLDLSALGIRLAVFALAALLLCGATGLAMVQFITNSAATPNLPVELAVLEAIADYVPSSAAVHARLAARLVESEADPTESHEKLAERAFVAASRAVQLAPANYEYRVLLAAASELQGDLPAAESALRAAVQRAPQHLDVRWQLANLLVRVGKLEEALPDFRLLSAADADRLPATISLLWQASEGNFELVKRGLSEAPHAQLALAGFLVEQGQYETAAGVFAAIPREFRASAPETKKIFDQLFNDRQFVYANQWWRNTVNLPATTTDSLLWNPGFEQPALKGLTHFDWQLVGSRYARIGVATGRAHSGQRALKLQYLGVETTRLDTELQQLVVLQPGATYRLEAYAKAEGLVVTDGPQLTIARADNRAVLAASNAVLPGTADWQLLTVEFVAPQDSPTIILTLKQTPRYSFVEPTLGVIWFDDFSLKIQ